MTELPEDTLAPETIQTPPPPSYLRLSLAFICVSCAVPSIKTIYSKLLVLVLDKEMYKGASKVNQPTIE